MSGVAGLVLAAGASRRMGRPKMLLRFGAETLLARIVRAQLASALDRVVVVLGSEADAVRDGAALPEDTRLSVVVNPGWQEGMASSLRLGAEACRASDAILVSLGDQPGLTPERITAVLSAWRSGVPIVVPVHQDRPGHPVLFARALFDELRALRGDVGAREVVRRHWAEAVRVEAPPLADVDTEGDYEGWRG